MFRCSLADFDIYRDTISCCSKEHGSGLPVEKESRATARCSAACGFAAHENIDERFAVDGVAGER